ncbi:MFS transporter [Bacillus sp. FJAT-29790]|uniref:MFS transporter n=1 Tax=Bacillus sp. FJAT-29790 TaxID=1895002 RepID=UPI001C23BE8D|nr:MFS transporter [Bacillus sp. FJAT-29790]MBU8880710.1 MFS transporter [Bacillus sp. FJAT-29790]
MAKRDKKITLRTSIGFGLTDIMGGGAFTVIGAWLLFFYTTFVGLSPVEAASIIAIARIVDAVISLFIGGLTDNFFKNKLGRKFGRRRFFLLIGSPLMLTYVLLWFTGMNYWYYLGTYLLFEIVAAMVLIPWETLPSEMTKDFNERTKMSTARMFLSATGTFLATFIPGQLIAAFGQDNAYAYFINGAFFAVLFAICVFISYKSTWEDKLTPEEEKALLAKANEHKGFGGTVKSITEVLRGYVSTFKIKSFRKHLAIYIFSFTAKDVYNAVFIFFCVFALNTSTTLGANLLSLSIIGIPTTIVSGFLFAKIGPGNLFKIAYSTMIVCLLGFWAVYLIQPSSMVITLFVIAGIYQIGRSMLEFTPWNVYPFIPDVDEIVTKERREGLFAAVMTFFRKTSVAVATFIVGLLLEWGGFEKGATTQSPEAIQTIVYTLVIGTIALLLIALLIAFTFKLNKQTHAILVSEIERLKNNGSKQDVDPKTKEVVEALTGYKYENVWDENKAGSY